MDWRRVVGGLGRTLIAAGLLILLFVAYELFGTNLAEQKSQRRLRHSIESQLPAAPPAGTPARPPTTVDPGAVPAVVPPAPPEGDAIAILKLPTVGVEKAVVEGVSLQDLKKGPGHYPGTPAPGQPGNAAIAGHRTTYGAPFYRLDELKAGDPIFVTTRQGRFRYTVTQSKVVSPNEVSVLDPTPDNRLTLTTCNPRFSAAQRLIVVASLDGEAAAAPPPAPVVSPPASAAAPTAPARSAGGGLSGRGASRTPVVAWGLLAALVWALTWLASRRWRRWPAYVVGTPVFLVVLFVFFENFSRLLPSNI